MKTLILLESLLLFLVAQFALDSANVPLFAEDSDETDEAFDEIVQNDSSMKCVQRVMLHSKDADKAMSECFPSGDEEETKLRQVQDPEDTRVKQDPWGRRRSSRRRSFRRQTYRRRSYRRRTYRRITYRRRTYRRRIYRRRTYRRRTYRRRTYRRRTYRRRTYRRRTYRRRTYRRRTYRRRTYRRRTYRRRTYRRRTYRRRTYRRRTYRRRAYRRRTYRRRTFRRRSGTRRRSGPFKANGCSIPFNLPFFYKKAFTPACNQHDRCYHYRTGSRLTCDKTFLRNMMKTCVRRARSFWGKLTYITCVKFGTVYYGGVRIGGKKHYG